MRVENWNPNKMDETFENVAIERLVKAAELIKITARRKCPVGTISRPMYRTGPYAGQYWTARDAGALKRSIRVVRKKTKSGKALTKKRNVRVYAGTKKAFYAQVVEYSSKPFMRTAMAQSLDRVKRIIGVK
ncbi:MAG: hypothetical protein KKE05_00920 [Nanoarchaeota archaeon]|nr:hypothetical protein [Nanoarchaeota archaeon]